MSQCRPTFGQAGGLDADDLLNISTGPLEVMEGTRLLLALNVCL